MSKISCARPVAPFYPALAPQKTRSRALENFTLALAQTTMARTSTKTTTKAASAKRGRGAKAAKPAAPPASADGASHVGSRVAKVFSGEIFHGECDRRAPPLVVHQ